MKKFGLILVWLLSLSALSIFFLGASMMEESEEDALLLFVKEEDDAEKLYIFNATTGEEHFVSNLVGGYPDAGWLPDGRVWILDSLGEAKQLRFFTPETGTESIFEDRLLDWCAPTLAWSPSGEQIAYLQREGDGLFIKFLNLKTGSSFQFPTSFQEFDVLPHWSPDGNYIMARQYFHSSSAHILRASDGQEILSARQFFGFSPDNHYLAYADESLNLHLYELATGERIATGIAGVAFDSRRHTSEFQWSPSGRYVAAGTTDSPNEVTYYDIENASLQTIDFGTPIQFAAWLSDASQIIVYADFVNASLKDSPATILSYTLATGEISSIVSDAAYINNALPTYRNGEWLMLRYSAKLPDWEQPYNVTTNLLFLNGQEQLDFDLFLGNWWFSNDIFGLGDARGFVMNGVDGLYYFNTQDNSLKLIDSDFYGGQILSSVDGNYLAYTSIGNTHLSVWNLESQANSLSLGADHFGIGIIGWRGSSERDSYLVCPEG